MVIEFDTDTFQVAKKWWTFCDGITFKLQSRERMAVKISNGVRTWESIQHLSFNNYGIWLGGSYEILSQTAETKIVGNSATSYVKYSLRYHPLARFEFGAFETGFKDSFAAWDVNFAKQ